MRLKGFAWLATRNKRQVNLALAGTQFSVSPGPPWWAFLGREHWPDGLEAVFMPAEKVLSLTLTADQPLAAQSATRVMEEIAAKGYFLQLPPQPSSSDASEPTPC